MAWPPAKVAGLIGGDYRPPQIEFDVQRLTEYYHSLGFLDARVGRHVTHSADHQYATVTFFVEEGQRYKVGRVQITGNSTFDERKLLSYTDLRENTLQDVITKLEPELFQTVTGLTVKDFHLLVRLKVFNTEQMNQAASRRLKGLRAPNGCDQ